MRKWLLTFFAGVLATNASAATIDIRSCPLDTVVFVDPWAGGEFAVKRVGTDYLWQCPDGVEPPDVNCMGPYGDLVLEGEYRKYSGSQPETMSAIWSVIKGVPCCGWSVVKGTATPNGHGNFRWLTPAETPKLREMQWLSIEPENTLGFGNPIFAAACERR